MPSPYHDVEALERLSLLLHDDHDVDVFGVDVERGVPRDREPDLELSRQVLRAAERLRGGAEDDPQAAVEEHLLVDVVVLDRLRPALTIFSCILAGALTYKAAGASVRRTSSSLLSW